MKLKRWPADQPPLWSSDPIECIRDTFALPRDPINAIHGGKEGAWTYRTIMPEDAIPVEWCAVWACRDRVLIKYTHWERVYP